jgi:hypothetical protein
VHEVGHPEGDALDPLREPAHGLGGAVGDLGGVPRRDLGAPASKRPAELEDLRRRGGAAHVLGELVDPLERDVGGPLTEPH